MRAVAELAQLQRGEALVEMAVEELELQALQVVLLL
jgi:hypothetical protein